jgi:predicted RNase H-like nuclease
VVGVDGCRGGWIAVLRQGPDFRWRRLAALAELFAGAPRPAVVAVDIPIGLTDRGARLCDREAREQLGARRACVFPAPIRPLLSATSRAEASARRRRLEGKGVSCQAWAIVDKIREVDDLLRRHPAYRTVVREVHPELCFAALNGGRAVARSKHTAPGLARRVALVRAWCGQAVVRALAERRALGCGADDIVDAFATLWTADRIQRGRAIALPARPPRDSHGLPMAIVV